MEFNLQRRIPETQKGYDIVPYLTALFTHIGAITPKIRLDYNDVMVSLSEENFFIPVYQWHEDRNLIYGCDHGGRGKMSANSAIISVPSDGTRHRVATSQTWEKTL